MPDYLCTYCCAAFETKELITINLLSGWKQPVCPICIQNDYLEYIGEQDAE
jgi:hypothetical protein